MQFEPKTGILKTNFSWKLTRFILRKSSDFEWTFFWRWAKVFRPFSLKSAFYVSRETSAGILEEIKFIFFRSVGKNCSASFSIVRFSDPERFFGKKLLEKVYIFLCFFGFWGKIFQLSCQICVLRVHRESFRANFFFNFSHFAIKNGKSPEIKICMLKDCFSFHNLFYVGK